MLFKKIEEDKVIQILFLIPILVILFGISLDIYFTINESLNDNFITIKEIGDYIFFGSIMFYVFILMTFATTQRGIAIIFSIIITIYLMIPNINGNLLSNQDKLDSLKYFKNENCSYSENGITYNSTEYKKKFLKDNKLTEYEFNKYKRFISICEKKNKLKKIEERKKAKKEKEKVEFLKIKKELVNKSF